MADTNPVPGKGAKQAGIDYCFVDDGRPNALDIGGKLPVIDKKSGTKAAK